MTDDSLPPALRSILAVLVDRPDDVDLRLHAAELLLQHGQPAAAIAQCSAVLQLDRANTVAVQLLARATAALSAGNAPPARAEEPIETPAPAPSTDGFDWSHAEEQVRGIVEPAFVDEGPSPNETSEPDDDVEEPEIKLADVGGLDEVKRRLDLAFLTPMRNPELQAMYGRSLAGGLLLYGPPGCGKTFLARAIAGELGAHFYAVSLADVLDMWIGASERNLKSVFETARRNTPCVLFLDEVDALGQKRSHLRSNSAMRGTVNQLLTEMDSVKNDNDGLFVLGATNHPWDVDTALMRPGRFDRLILVVPPDVAARESILRFHLKKRPLEGIDVAKIARRTEHFSGADLAHLCDSAAEMALEDSVKSGSARPIRMSDFDRVGRDVKPSTGPWMEDARNVVAFANEGGRFDDLRDYLNARKLL